MMPRLPASIALLLFLGSVLAQPIAETRASAPKELTSPRERFEHYCKTIAGEKIYRKVEDVEGVLLLKVRPRPTAKQLADPDWPGAAFAFESYENGFIETFLGFEQPRFNGLSGKPIAITPSSRSYVTTDRQAGSIPGYKYVDVQQYDGSPTLRYTGRWEEPWQKDKSWRQGFVKFYLDSAHAPKTTARYAVTYEDHVIAEDRVAWIASSTIKVLDTRTQEVLAELTRYALGQPPSNATPAPWLAARVCPGHGMGANAATRKFVDQVLVPKKG